MRNKSLAGANYLSSLNAFFKLVRIEHALMYAIAVLIGAVIVGGIEAVSAFILIGALAAMFLEFGAFALNDYIDLKADRINGRIDRPLVTGEISPSMALLIGFFSFIFANLISFIYLPIQAFYIIFLFTMLSLLYDFILKNLPLIGNIIIALTMAVPFFFGAFILAVEKNIPVVQFQPVLCLSAIAFFVGLGREIIKDIEDMKGDQAIGGKTLPILIGKRNAARFAVLLFFIGIILSIIPFFTFFSGRPLYLTVLITDIMLADVSLHVLKDQSIQNLRKSRKMSLIAIGIGLISFLLSSIF
ncbi:MAG: UbiA family prenyltransferase [Candidatus Micrarchaeia archaeon]